MHSPDNSEIFTIINRFTVPLIAASWRREDGQFLNNDELTEKMVIKWVENYGMPDVTRNRHYVVRQDDMTHEGTSNKNAVVDSLVSISKMREVLADIKSAVIMLYCYKARDYATAREFIEFKEGQPAIKITHNSFGAGSREHKRSVIYRFEDFSKKFYRPQGETLNPDQAFQENDEAVYYLVSLILEDLINKGYKKFPPTEQVDVRCHYVGETLKCDFTEAVINNTCITNIWTSIAYRVTMDKRNWLDSFFRCKKCGAGWIFKQIGKGAPAKQCDKCRFEDRGSKERVRKHRKKKKQEG